MPEYEREETYRPIEGFPARSTGLRAKPPNFRRKKVQMDVTVEEFRQLRQTAANLRIPVTDLLRRYTQRFWADLENGIIESEIIRLRDSNE